MISFCMVVAGSTFFDGAHLRLEIFLVELIERDGSLGYIK